ncbi:redoxin domain-containing protein [Puniceicoccus vermicola]|uniref:Redoxin domain-containing protein n=1 Tax=Puniceicoccus vermicola TaxID=388746 RepID=A0A7X1AY85_9BACT|nr:redoxin domain-containing protein [Puniceicoccus vermicola]MBC2602176.1 redoxin domain-containing protein [Puniceicoccus vermicola]
MPDSTHSPNAGNSPDPGDIGSEAPTFSLSSLDGQRIDLERICQSQNVLLWFSRGFQCNFCRSHMMEFIGGYDQVKQVGAELIQVAPNLSSSAQRFFGSDIPPFPFVCDPDKRLYAVYGLGDRGALDAAKNAVVTLATSIKTGEIGTTARGVYLDVANRNFFRRLHHHAATAVEHGLFLIDRGRIIQHKTVVGPIDPIPQIEEMMSIIRERCLA